MSSTSSRNPKNLQATFDALKASDERRRARMSPEAKRIASAAALTPGEQGELADATAAVAQAEQAMADLLLKKADLEDATRSDLEQWTDHAGVFSRLVRRPPDPARAAAAKDALDGFPLMEQVARDQLQIAVRARNQAERRVSTARTQRRYAMEASLSPPMPKPVMVTDKWQAPTSRRYRQGGG